MLEKRFWMRALKVLNVPVRFLVVLFIVGSALPLRSVNALSPIAPITITGTLSEFSSIAGVPSAEQTFTVSAVGLTDDLLVTTPTDFEVSLTTGSGFVSTLTLPQTDGIVAEMLIYVRMNSVTVGLTSGNIKATSKGARKEHLTVSGVVIAPNQAPDMPILVQPADKGVNVSILPTLEVTVTDPDADAMDISFLGREVGAPTFDLIGSATGVASGSNVSVSWTGLAESTEYEWYVEVSDGSLSITGNTWSFTTETIIRNAAPELGSIGAKSVDELDTLSFTATATDDGLPSGTLTYSLADGTEGLVPAGASIDGTSGEFAWTPAEEQGPGSFTFDVCASDGELFTCETITVTVNEVNVEPVLTPIGSKSGDEMGYYEYQASATDADLPANTLTFSLADGTSGSVPAGMAITAGGLWSWTPSEEQGPGVYKFDLCVSDGTLSDCETIEVTVSEVNTAPVLGSIGAKSVDELVELTFTAAATDDDIPANTLTFSLENSTSGLVPAGASINSVSGEFSWTPTADQGPNAYTFDVCVSDGIGSDCETITVTVNDVPVPVAKSPFGTITKRNPAFTWTVTPTATQYHLLVVNKSGVTVLDKTLTNVICGTSTCSYVSSPSLNLAVGNYSWKVQAYTGDWGDYSATRFFREAKLPSPKTPSISSTSSNPKFYWSKVYGQKRYQIVLRTTSGKLIMSKVITTPTCNLYICYYTPGPALGLSNGAYKWKVRSYNNGIWGDWSAFVFFKKVDLNPR